jgi:peroxiredoxin
MVELEALQEIDSEVRALGARIVALTPELDRYARSVHKKLNLTFDLLTDLHLKSRFMTSGLRATQPASEMLPQLTVKPGRVRPRRWREKASRKAFPAQ